MNSSVAVICPGRVFKLQVNYAASDGRRTDALSYVLGWDTRFLSLVKADHARMPDCELRSFVYHRPTPPKHTEWVKFVCADHRVRSAISAKTPVAPRIEGLAILTLVANPAMPAGGATSVQLHAGKYVATGYQMVVQRDLSLGALYDGHEECDGLRAQATANCVVGPWDAWSRCDRTCGGGTQYQRRPVLQHRVGKLGRDCPKLTRTRACHTSSCATLPPTPAPPTPSTTAPQTPPPTPIFAGCHTELGDTVPHGWLGAGIGPAYCNRCRCHKGTMDCGMAKKQCGDARAEGLQCTHVRCTLFDPAMPASAYHVIHASGEVNGIYHDCSQRGSQRCQCICNNGTAANGAQHVWPRAQELAAGEMAAKTVLPNKFADANDESDALDTLDTAAADVGSGGHAAPAPDDLPSADADGAVATSVGPIEVPAHAGREVMLERDFVDNADEKPDDTTLITACPCMPMQSMASARETTGVVVCVLLVLVVVGSVCLLWHRAHLYPLRSGGRSKILYTISAVGALLIGIVPLEEAVGPLPVLRIVALGMFAPLFGFPLVVALRRYSTEWQIHSLLKTMVESQHAQRQQQEQREQEQQHDNRPARSRTEVKRYEEQGAQGKYGANVQRQVQHLRNLSSLPTSLRHVALRVAPCAVATAGFAASYAALAPDSAARDAWRRGVSPASPGLWFRVFLWLVCAYVLLRLLSGVRRSRQRNMYDSFGIRGEFLVAATGGMLFLGLSAVLFFARAGERGGGGMPWPSYMGVLAAMHVVASMLLWPALRTFRLFGAQPHVAGRRGRRGASTAALEAGQRLNAGRRVSSSNFAAAARASIVGVFASTFGGVGGGGEAAEIHGSDDSGEAAAPAARGGATGWATGGGAAPRWGRAGSWRRGAGSSAERHAEGQAAAAGAAAGAAVALVRAEAEPKAAADIGLEAVLESDTGYSQFAEHLREEFAVESLLFWRGCADFRRTAVVATGDSGAGAADAGGAGSAGAGVGAAAARRERRLAQRHAVRAKAGELLELYVQEGAAFQVNISSTQRAEIVAVVERALDRGAGGAGRWGWDTTSLPALPANASRITAAAHAVGGRWLVVGLGNHDGPAASLESALVPHRLDLRAAPAERRWAPIAPHPLSASLGLELSVPISAAAAGKWLVFGGQYVLPAASAAAAAWAGIAPDLATMAVFGPRPTGSTVDVRSAYEYDFESDAWAALPKMPLAMVQGPKLAPVVGPRGGPSPRYVLLLGAQRRLTARRGGEPPGYMQTVGRPEIPGQVQYYGDDAIFYDTERRVYGSLGKLPYGVVTANWVCNGTHALGFGGEPTHGWNGNTETVVQRAAIRFK
eukprot:g1338.t1